MNHEQVEAAMVELFPTMTSEQRVKDAREAIRHAITYGTSNDVLTEAATAALAIAEALIAELEAEVARKDAALARIKDRSGFHSSGLARDLFAICTAALNKEAP